MYDTSNHANKVYQDMMALRSPEERLIMGCSMFTTAKILAEASIRQNTPGLSQVEIKKEIFLRFYGEDFNPVSREKILIGFDQ